MNIKKLKLKKICFERKWVAKNKDGQINLFIQKPIIRGNIWDYRHKTKEKTRKWPFKDYPKCNWDKSLRVVYRNKLVSPITFKRKKIFTKKGKEIRDAFWKQWRKDWGYDQ